MFMSLPSGVTVLETMLVKMIMITPSVCSMRLTTFGSHILPTGTMRWAVVQPSSVVVLLNITTTGFITVQ